MRGKIFCRVLKVVVQLTFLLFMSENAVESENINKGTYFLSMYSIRAVFNFQTRLTVFLASVLFLLLADAGAGRISIFTSHLTLEAAVYKRTAEFLQRHM